MNLTMHNLHNKRYCIYSFFSLKRGIVENPAGVQQQQQSKLHATDFIWFGLFGFSIGAN
jgi:hypothetical protein